jgi:hypothetical protein
LFTRCAALSFGGWFRAESKQASENLRAIAFASDDFIDVEDVEPAVADAQQARHAPQFPDRSAHSHVCPVAFCPPAPKPTGPYFRSSAYERKLFHALPMITPFIHHLLFFLLTSCRPCPSATLRTRSATFACWPLIEIRFFLLLLPQKEHPESNQNGSCCSFAVSF